MKKYTKGLNLYKKASKIIPGGVQLLSKKPEIYLPDLWPSYYVSAKGSEIITLDNKKLFDFTNCSVGMCPLGYSNQYVNKAVVDVIKKGNVSTLNSYLEIKCAKVILDLHKWAHMARFTKSGGEAVSVAVRIARSYTNKDKVLFCGYHGWHDWYISANLKDKNKLNKHLLPGISSSGIPKSLKNTSIPYEFNNIKDFEKKFLNNLKSLSCVILEPARSNHPQMSFLKKIRYYCTKFNIPLIFDEITLGWHCALGGYHKLKKINPDIAVFSKGTTNGYPLGVIIGKKKIMKAANSSFISSAYWSENLGYAAAIATINYMKKNNVAKKLEKKGIKIKKIWEMAAKKYKVDLIINGVNSLPSFNFKNENSSRIMTYFTQEMLAKGFLANGTCYVMLSHTDKLLSKYQNAFNKVFEKISKLQRRKIDFRKVLKGREKFIKFKNPV